MLHRTLRTAPPPQLRSFGRDSVVSLGANVGNMVSKAVGIPLVGRAAGIGYNQLSINAGIGFDVAQTIGMELRSIETFDFLSPVQHLQAGGVWSAPTKQVVIPLGQDLVLKSNVRNLGVVPSTSLEVTFSNLTELIVQGDVNVQALAADIYDLEIGPLYDSGSVNAGHVSIPLYQGSFSFEASALTGLPFNIVQALPDQINADPGYRALFAAGQQNSDGLEAGEIRLLDLGCMLIFSCSSVHSADTDLSMLNQYGERVFMLDGATLALSVNNPGEVGTERIAAGAALRHRLLARAHRADLSDWPAQRHPRAHELGLDADGSGRRGRSRSATRPATIRRLIRVLRAPGAMARFAPWTESS